jgi:hypothetical protein
MEQQAEFTQKKRIKMKQINTTLILLLISLFQSHAQNCIDTVHIKGYYVIMRLKREVSNPKIVKYDKSTRVARFNVDVHREASFIPEDSIFGKQSLAYRLNHFFDDANEVFISCEKSNVKDYIKGACLEKIKNTNGDSCLFPTLKSNFLYETTNRNTGDVFEIYYLDAYWARVTIETGSPEASIIPSRIAQTCISQNIKVFDLYCFIRCNNVQLSPQIKDPHIAIWKNK